MRVLITGGAGFLGALLSRRLLANKVALGGRQPRKVEELILLDLVMPPADVSADHRVSVLIGALEQHLTKISDVDAVFHFAGVVSGAAETDFDLGMKTNVDGLRVLLEWCRAHRTPPVMIFTSSLAVFGADPAIGPLGDVDDGTLPCPQSSYGTQKFIGEQLVADYTRKGFVRGRSIRLMTVAVRPGRPNAAASSFMSGIIREPLSGEQAECPVPPDMPIAVSSPRKTIDGIVRAAEVSDSEWGSRTAMNLPALTTTAREMVAALENVSGPAVAKLVHWAEDPAVMAIVGGWPSRFLTNRATALGLAAEVSFEDIIRQYVADGDQSTSRRGFPGEFKIQTDRGFVGELSDLVPLSLDVAGPPVLKSDPAGER